MTELKQWEKDYLRYRKYTDFIQHRCRQPGTRAALRSGLRRTPEQAPRMHAVVAARVPSWVDAAEERAYYTVAALIAGQPRAGRDNSEPQPEVAEQQDGDAETRPQPRSLGQALAELEIKTRKRDRADAETQRGRNDADTSAAMSPLERRLHALSRQSVDGVHRQLAPIVLRIRGAEVPVDWAQLLADLVRWRLDQDRVTKRWLQDFYRYRFVSTTPDQAASSPEGTQP